MNAPPSAFALQRCVSEAMRTIETLREDHGQIFDTPDDVLAVLAEDGIGVVKILRQLTWAALEAKAAGIAVSVLITDLKMRADRFERQEAAYRSTVAMVMEALIPADNDGNRRLKEPQFSLTLAPGKPKVIVTETDPRRLPDEWVTVVTTRTPDKARIKTALEERRAAINVALEHGMDAPPELEGVMLSQAPPVLTVRTR
jgi:Siphovirus Gp157